MWQAGGDSDDILLDAIRNAIGNGTSGSSNNCQTFERVRIQSLPPITVHECLISVMTDSDRESFVGDTPTRLQDVLSICCAQEDVCPLLCSCAQQQAPGQEDHLFNSDRDRSAVWRHWIRNIDPSGYRFSIPSSASRSGIWASLLLILLAVPWSKF